MTGAEAFEQNVRHRIARLPKLSRQELLALWKEVYGGKAPVVIRRELLIPFLAYRIQERAWGGLKPSTRAELRRISRALDKGDANAKPIMTRQIKPGTRIGRLWRGKWHEVLITESGFEHCGLSYGSLSQVARKITGTQWSGPAFFGLRKARPARGDSDE
jgi:hypothetical protein